MSWTKPRNFVELAIVAGASMIPSIRAKIYQAAQLERITLTGKAMGMQAEHVDEVIEAWIDWYRKTPWPTDLDRIRRAVVLRGNGLEWQPPGHATAAQMPHAPAVVNAEPLSGPGEGEALRLARIHAPELREEGFKQARIEGVNPECARVYGAGWAAGYARALEDMARGDAG